MSNALTVPAPLLPTLRSALITELGDAAEEISKITELPDQERSAERFAAHLSAFDAHRGLLDLVGWSQTRDRVPIAIDTAHDRWALQRALENRLAVELDYADVDPGLVGAASQRERATATASAIQAFLASPAFREHETG